MEINIVLMFIAIGCVFNLYIVQLLITDKFTTTKSRSYIGHNTVYSRISIFIILLTLYFDYKWSLHITDVIVTFDGLFSISYFKLFLESFLLLLSIPIIFVLGLDMFPLPSIRRDVLRAPSIKGELFLMLLSNLVGVLGIIYSNDWILAVLSWELMNMTLYLIVSSNLTSESELSASLKYFILSALSTGFLLIGVAILYSITGSTNFDKISLFKEYDLCNPSYDIGFGFIIISLLFKLGAAPLHNWAPDLYNAIHSKLALWMMIIPKFSVLSFLYLLLIRLSSFSLLPLSHSLFLILSISSLFIGSLGLYSQWRIKRYIAFSGISNIGFILISLYSLDPSSYFLYTFIYLLTVLNVLLILIIFSLYKNQEILFTSQLHGLFILNLPLSLAFISSIFSLAGIPPFLGFFSKYLVLSSLLSLNLDYKFFICFIAILTSALGCYRYLYLVRLSLFHFNPILLPISVSPFLAYLISSISVFLLFGFLKPLSLLHLTLASFPLS